MVQDQNVKTEPSCYLSSLTIMQEMKYIYTNDFVYQLLESYVYLYTTLGENLDDFSLTLMIFSNFNMVEGGNFNVYSLIVGFFLNYLIADIFFPNF